MAYYLNNRASNLLQPGVAKNDPAYDELAWLYLARGLDGYFNIARGHATFASSGSSTWTNDPRSLDTRLSLMPNANAGGSLSGLIERLVMGSASTWRTPTG